MLIHDFVFMANVMQPRVCIIENVPPIVSSDVFHHACDRLRAGGYLVNYKVLVSSNFGVPQRRRRLFTLAVRSDVAKKCGIDKEKDIIKLFPVGSSREPTLREALTDVPIDPQEREMLLSACRRNSKYELIKRIPLSPPKPMGIKDMQSNWTSDFNLVRSSWDHPCPTITVMGAQLGRSSNFHPDENRVFTISELKRITGLPDDFKLKGTFDQRAERIGRMVPPLMTTALASAVYEKVLSRL
jgi:DNA (cytosine-5)-methyltransferase 1